MADKQIRYATLCPMFEELRGTRVVLRPYTLADAEARHLANAESRDHLRPWEPEQADAFHPLMKRVTGLFVSLPIGCCGNGFRWACGIWKPNAI